MQTNGKQGGLGLIKGSEPKTARLELRLLGQPQVHFNGVAVNDFRTAKVQALLYYLAVTGRPHGRESLVTLLWGDMPEATAKRNLTQVLSLLRKQFAQVLEITPQQIGLKPEATYWVDVEQFQQTLETIHPAQEPERLRQVVDLYRGDFLQGFYVKAALDFEEWVLAQRERLRELLIQALDSLVNHYLRQADYPAGLDIAARLLALEPWRETAHRQIMLLLAHSGRREAALAQYETCRQVLAQELGVEPTAMTTALYQRLKVASTSLPHNLPSPTIFVGRERELAHLPSRLSQPDCRLLTLVGPGGIGKTRLAIEVARRCLQPVFEPGEAGFADGVYFVNLAPVGASETRTGGPPASSQVANLILVAIAAGLDFFFQGAADLKPQLLAHLRHKEMLLVLDNFEHLVAGAGLLVELLQAAPGVRLLVTSRERLNLQEEWVWEVGGLDYPAEDWTGGLAGVERGDDMQASISGLQAYDAVALFCLQAQRVRGDFSLTENEAPHVLRLCQLVEGAPLALELAASWLRVLSCAEVVAGVQRSLDFLTSSLRNVPPRHRSMRAVFKQSWQMLSGPEQVAFGRLWLFKGGFQREAAQAVAGAGLPTLANLVDKSLLRVTPSGRYQVHELLRQFAAEELLAGEEPVKPSDQPAEPAFVLWQRYSSYYLDLVGQRETSLRGSAPQPALLELRADLDNIRQAWQWAVIAGQIEDIDGALGGLARFYDLTSLFEEGAAVFGRAAHDLQVPAGSLAEASKQALQKTVVRLWVEQARLLNRRGLSEQALQVIPQAVEMAHQIGDTTLEALAYHQWGETLSFHGQPVLAQERLEEALRLARTAGLGALEAEALRHLGISRIDQGDVAGALQYYQEALACFRRLEDRRGEGMVLNNLALLQRGQGQWAAAETHYEQALHIFQEIDYRWGQDVVLNNLGNLRYDLGQYSQAQALCQQGLQICAQIKDYWGEGHLLNSLGNIKREQGDFSAAHNYYQQALQLWRTIGARLYEGTTLAELSLLWHLRGDNQAAYDYGQQAHQIGQDLGSPAIRALALTHLGHAQADLGFLAEAAESYRQALTLHQEMGQLFFAREALAGLGRVAQAQGHLAQAQAYAAKLLPELEIEHLYGMRQPFWVYLTCYQALHAGQDPLAGEVLAAAYRLLHQRAAQLADEQVRRLYLENIRAHQEIVREYTKQVVRPI